MRGQPDAGDYDGQPRILASAEAPCRTPPKCTVPRPGKVRRHRQQRLPSPSGPAASCLQEQPRPRRRPGQAGAAHGKAHGQELGWRHSNAGIRARPGPVIPRRAWKRLSLKRRQRTPICRRKSRSRPPKRRARAKARLPWRCSRKGSRARPWACLRQASLKTPRRSISSISTPGARRKSPRSSPMQSRAYASRAGRTREETFLTR